MLLPPTSTSIKHLELLREGSLPTGHRALDLEQMIMITRRLFFAAPGYRDPAICSKARSLLTLQKDKISIDPQLCTGFELNNFHVLTKPERAYYLSTELYNRVQSAARSLGFDTRKEHDNFKNAEKLYLENGDEQLYENSAKHFFSNFLRPVYLKLRQAGYDHNTLTG